MLTRLVGWVKLLLWYGFLTIAVGVAAVALMALGVKVQ